MKISEAGVNRPVTTLMIFLGVLILGIVSYTQLSVDMMPEIETPTISVYTTWDGASTEDVETQITRVIESALGSVTDLDEMTSITCDVQIQMGHGAGGSRQRHARPPGARQTAAAG